MKNLLLIPVLVFALTSIKATDLPTLKIVKDKTFVLNINDWNADVLTISFLTKRGEEVYSESIRPAVKKSRRYNLQLLARGAYKMVVSDDFKNVTYDIEVTQDNVKNVSKGVTAFLPQVLHTDNNVDVNFLALGKHVRVTLYDDYGNDLYAETFKKAQVITKRLNISNLESGAYTLSISTGNKNYSHIIRK